MKGDEGMKKHISIYVLSLGLLTFSGLAQAGEQTFHRPTISGVRLDWCYHWAQECGQPAADAFCRQEGYDRATKFAQVPDVPPTYVLGDQRTCNAPGCDAIGDITCIR
jgi:hypothetical protein